eukprot:2871546-Amphidinium_carterae.1
MSQKDKSLQVPDGHLLEVNVYCPYVEACGGDKLDPKTRRREEEGVSKPAASTPRVRLRTPNLA